MMKFIKNFNNSPYKIFLLIALVLYYPAINAILIELLGIKTKLYSVSISTILLIFILNISAIYLFKKYNYNIWEKNTIVFLTLFLYFLNINDAEFNIKDVQYMFCVIIPSYIILKNLYKAITSNSSCFIKFNTTILTIICIFLIFLPQRPIDLRASLPHLNANTYSTFGAYLIISICVLVENIKIRDYIYKLFMALIGIITLALGNSVGISIITFLLLFIILIQEKKMKNKIFIIIILLLILVIFKFINFNQADLTITDRLDNVVVNTSSTLYDRLDVYKYLAKSFWLHFFKGAEFNLYGIKTAHNIFIEIYLVSGILGLIFFTIILLKSIINWLSVSKTSYTQYLFYLFIFSFIESLYRGRLTLSVILVALILLSLSDNFIKKSGNEM